MKTSRRRRRRKFTARFFILLALLAIVVTLALLILLPGGNGESNSDDSQSGGFLGLNLGGDKTTPTPGATATPEPTPEPTPTPVPIPDPTSVPGTTEEDFGLEIDMQLESEDISEYQALADLTFPDASDYQQIEGVLTFRGNNYRNDPTYGTAGAVSEKKLELAWTTEIPGSIAKGTDSGAWFGCGWTGQPLIVNWPDSTKNIMNLYDEKKGKDNLKEIIYATENSYIYFLDLEDGSYTRDRVYGKWAYKGSGSIDPRGYPLLYVGAGDDGPNGPAENMIISLIDGHKIYSYGARDSFSNRSWYAFDAATLVNAENDIVTYASECGIIYQFKLNTQYDEAAGTISVNPTNILKWSYTTKRNRDSSSKYWLGFESSPVIWRNYMYVADNAGDLFCIDINTMNVVWMQDVMDDTNCSPVLDINEETGEVAIYIGTSLHWTVDDNNTGIIPFWKIDALTGEILWKADGYRCTRSSVSGGIQDTAALGKNNVSDLVYVAYAMTTEADTRGQLVAYYKESGEKAWTKSLNSYSWSSPIILYDDNGDGYVVEFDSAGMCYLFDGRTGEKLDQLELEGNFEASAAAYDDMIVIGTRAEKIYGIKLK